MSRKLLMMAAIIAMGCQGPLEDVGGEIVETEVDEDDPLTFDEQLDPQSFDALHREVILPSCAAVEAFCHYGQFEPNLTTPALAYESLVNRPGIELFDRRRVTPGDPEGSLLIDKIRGRAGVATVMPLGAPPMPEDHVKRLEDWIRNGALRYPGADPAPQLNEAPLPPEVAVYDAGGQQLGPGSTIFPGQVVTLRHSVKDFETADAQIPYGAFTMIIGDGRNIWFSPEVGATLPSSYDPMGPEGSGDMLNWEMQWVVPEILDVTEDGMQVDDQVPSAGQTLTVLAFYIDALPAAGGMLTFNFELNAVTVGGTP